jgi:hypothetical protein
MLRDFRDVSNGHGMKKVGLFFTVKNRSARSVAGFGPSRCQYVYKFLKIL